MRLNKILFFLSFILGSTHIFCQNLSIDSLYKQLNKSNQDSSRYSILMKIGSYYQDNNPDTSIVIFHLAINVAKKIPIPEGELNQGEAIRNIGWSYAIKGEINQSKDFFNKSYKIAEKYILHKDPYIHKMANKNLAACIGSLGSLHFNLSDYPKSLEYHFRALKINEKIGNKNLIASNYNNIGLVYATLEDLDKALDYFLRSMKINEELNNTKSKVTNLGNIGLIYMYQEKFDSSLKYLFEALEISEEIGKKTSQSDNLTNIGIVYMKKKEYNNALKYCFKAFEISKELGSKQNQAIILVNIGRTYIYLKQYSKAEKYLKQAELINNELNSLFNLEGNYFCLYTMYEENKNFQNALSYYKKFNIIQDSIENDENTKAGVQQEMKYEFEKQAAVDSISNFKEIEIKEVEIAKQQAEIKAKNNQQYALLGGLALVVVFGGFMVNRYLVTKKQRNTIEEQRKEVIIQKTEAEHQRDEVSKQKEIIEIAHKEITDSINYAKRIQNAILPPLRLVKEKLPQSFILYQPKDVVAGDFYWMEQKNNTLMIAAADCTGHGVPGAMVSVVCVNGLNRSVREYNLTEPGKILDKTREIVVEEFEKSDEDVKDGMDISICSFDFKTNILKWAGANNPLWIIRKGNTEIEEIKANKQPIGKTENPLLFTTHSTEFNEGDTLYIFTDGYQDQFGGEKGKKFKAAQLKELLLSIQHENMEKQLAIIANAFEKWKGNLEQVDDVCVIGVRG